MIKIVSSAAFTSFIAMCGFLQADLCHIEEGKRLVFEEALFLQEKLHFSLFSCGGGYKDCINSLEITVEVPGKLDLPKARIVFTGVIENWLRKINQDQQARPYYKNYPMTLDNIELRMMFADFDIESNPEKPRIACVFNVGEKIVYCLRNELGVLEPFYRESFREAVAKIKKGQ